MSVTTPKRASALIMSPTSKGLRKSMFIPPKKFFAISWLARPKAIVKNPSEVHIGLRGKPTASAKNKAVKTASAQQ